MPQKVCIVRKCTAKVLVMYKPRMPMYNKKIADIEIEKAGNGRVILNFKMQDGSALSMILPMNKVYEVLMDWIQEFPEMDKMAKTA